MRSFNIVLRLAFLTHPLIGIGCATPSSDMDRGTLPRANSQPNEAERDSQCPKENAEQETLPPRDLIRGNLFSTDLTILLEIDSVEVSKTLKDDSGKSGYIGYFLRGTILRIYRGSTQKKAVFYETVQELPGSEPRPGQKYIVSFRIDPDGRLVVPGEVYEFLYSCELDRLFSLLSTDSKQKSEIETQLPKEKESDHSQTAGSQDQVN